MGLGDWRLLVALVSSFVAKENSVATLGVLFGVTGVSATAAGPGLERPKWPRWSLRRRPRLFWCC